MNPLAHEVGSSREADRREGEGDRVAPQHLHAASPNRAGEGFVDAIRRRVTRHATAQREGQPSLGGYLAQAGVLGWTIVIPALLAMYVGRWVDRRLGTGIFWTAPLMLAGLAIGCWSAWRWLHRR